MIIWSLGPPLMCKSLRKIVGLFQINVLASRLTAELSFVESFVGSFLGFLELHEPLDLHVSNKLDIVSVELVEHFEQLVQNHYGVVFR